MRIDKQVHIETEDDELPRVWGRVGSVYTMYAVHVFCVHTPILGTSSRGGCSHPGWNIAYDIKF